MRWAAWPSSTSTVSSSTSTTSRFKRTSDGIAVLRSVGQQRYKGIDVEGALRPAKGWTDQGQCHLERCPLRDYVTDIDGTPTQLAGKHQVLTPSVRAGGGLLYAPERGWRGSLTSNWIGAHWLNSLNTFEAPAYAVVDASLGYRFDRFTVSIAADPTSATGATPCS